MKDQAAFDQVLSQYRARLAKEETLMASLPEAELRSRLDEFLLSVGEEIGALLQSLVVCLDAKVIVELGTSYGLSTLFLASAAQRTGGKLFTYEIAAHKQAYARQQITAAGLADSVEWCLGDAVQLLAEQEGPVDFVLMDLWKGLYVPCFNAVYPKIAPNGVIAADNMLYPTYARAEAAAYRAAVRAKPDMQAVLLPVGSGIDLSCRVAPGA